jgi:hypothetical protein
MTTDQFRSKRLRCHLDLAIGQLKNRDPETGGPTLPNAVVSGESIQVRIPGLSFEGDSELPREAERAADDVKHAVFDSGLRSGWALDPVSVNITGIAAQFVSGPNDYITNARHAEKLADHLSKLLENDRVPVTVTGRRSAPGKSMVPPQVSIVLYATLTPEAQARAETDRQKGIDPCPRSQK